MAYFFHFVVSQIDFIYRPSHSWIVLRSVLSTYTVILSRSRPLDQEIGQQECYLLCAGFLVRDNWQQPRLQRRRKFLLEEEVLRASMTFNVILSIFLWKITMWFCNGWLDINARKNKSYVLAELGGKMMVEIRFLALLYLYILRFFMM